MKNRFVSAGALVMALTLTWQTETKAVFTNGFGTVITNGVVFVTTRSASDSWFRTQSSSTVWDTDDPRGPGGFAPGDVKMCEVLMDYGYSPRLIPEKALSFQNNNLAGFTTFVDGSTTTDPYAYYYSGGFPGGNGITGGGTSPDERYSAALIICSGSGASADMPIANTNGIPIIMGEHSCLGNNRANNNGERSEIYLYSNRSGNSGNNTTTNSSNLYMKVVNPTHPIMQGIPLDSLGRVKMYRDPYPEENLHGPRAEGVAAGKLNYEVAWTFVDCSAGKAVPSPSLSILGVMDSNTNLVTFAVMDAGGLLSSEVTDTGHPWFGRTNAPSRLVQLFVNEGGNGNSRRGFNCLSDIGKVIFIRTCKWAMGETLTPYVPLGVIQTSMVSPSKLKLEWTGLATKNYKVLGTANLLAAADISNWQTVVEDIPGTNGSTSVKLDISNGPQYAYFRVMPVP